VWCRSCALACRCSRRELCDVRWLVREVGREFPALLSFFDETRAAVFCGVALLGSTFGVLTVAFWGVVASVPPTSGAVAAAFWGLPSTAPAFGPEAAAAPGMAAAELGFVATADAFVSG